MKVLHELLQFLLKNMECNIDFLFNKYSDDFNQSKKEFEEEGEKHRHYELYKKYERLIEEDIEEFCKKNNYNKPSDLILDIKDIINTETNQLVYITDCVRGQSPTHSRQPRPPRNPLSSPRGHGETSKMKHVSP